MDEVTYTITETQSGKEVARYGDFMSVIYFFGEKESDLSDMLGLSYKEAHEERQKEIFDSAMSAAQSLLQGMKPCFPMCKAG